MRACTPHPHTHTLPLYACSHIDPQSSPQCLAAIRLQNKSIPQARTGSSSRVSNINLQYAENTPVSALFHSLRSWGIFSFKVFLYFKIPAAKLLQSCPTLCDPIDGSPPGSSIHGIFQARVLEWGAIAFPVTIPSEPQNRLHLTLYLIYTRFLTSQVVAVNSISNKEPMKFYEQGNNTIRTA